MYLYQDPPCKHHFDWFYIDEQVPDLPEESSVVQYTIQYITVYHSILRVSQYTTDYHSIPQSITVYHRVSQYTTDYHSIPQSITVYHRLSQYTTEYHSIPQSITVYHRVSQYTTVYYNIIPKCSLHYISCHIMYMYLPKLEMRLTLMARMKSLHALQSPFFMAWAAATTCSRMLSGGPGERGSSWWICTPL